jgi:hypothetical protein
LKFEEKISEKILFPLFRPFWKIQEKIPFLFGSCHKPCFFFEKPQGNPNPKTFMAFSCFLVTLLFVCSLASKTEGLKPLVRLDNSSWAGLPDESWKPDPSRPITIANKPHHPDWIKAYNEYQTQHAQKIRDDDCSSDCVCADGGIRVHYGRYCAKSYSSCTADIPCDGLDFCCNFHDYCVGILGFTSCVCNDYLYTCAKNNLLEITIGVETPNCQYEASTSLTVVTETSLNPLCTVPKGDDLLVDSYTLYVRWPPGNHDLLFDYTASPSVYSDWVAMFPTSACQQEWDCSLWNTTIVRRQPSGRVHVTADTILDAVSYSGFYELRYFIEQPRYIYWVATSNSFYVQKN